MDVLLSLIAFLAVVLLWVLPSYWVALYAENTKGQSFIVFLLLGLITSFVVALLLALVLPPSVSSIAPAAHLGPDAHPFDRLEQLSSMHDRGVITDDEYVEQKARLLG